MNFYPHHVGDFDRATRHCTRLERSIYRDLMDLYYDTEQALTLDRAKLCKRILANSNEEATAVEQVLNEFFTETPTGWYHDRCEEEISKYHANNSQKSTAGKASAAKREAKRLQALNGIPTAVERACNGTPTNQEPITNNQEPLKKTKAQPDGFTPPDWINRKHWDTWHSCPKRKKATNDQKQMAVDKLDGWRQAGLDYAGALENAAIGGNQGLFLPSGGRPAASVGSKYAGAAAAIWGPTDKRTIDA